jgi:hypothetical protein
MSFAVITSAALLVAVLLWLAALDDARVEAARPAPGPAPHTSPSSGPSPMRNNSTGECNVAAQGRAYQRFAYARPDWARRQEIAELLTREPRQLTGVPA